MRNCKCTHHRYDHVLTMDNTNYSGLIYCHLCWCRNYEEEEEMHKVIIEHSTRKRQLNVPFNIYSDRDTLKHIADSIIDTLNKNDFDYGWVRIVDPVTQPTLPGKSENWNDGY